MTTREKAKWLTDKEKGLGMSVTALAKLCGYHYSALSHYLNDTMKHSPEKIEQAIEAAIPLMIEKLEQIAQ